MLGGPLGNEQFFDGDLWGSFLMEFEALLKCAVGEVGLGVECQHGEPCLFEAEAVGVGKSSRKGKKMLPFWVK